jgi:hypothetical protein
MSQANSDTNLGIHLILIYFDVEIGSVLLKDHALSIVITNWASTYNHPSLCHLDYDTNIWFYDSGILHLNNPQSSSMRA